MENAKISNLYDLNETIAKEYLEQFTYPWEALKGISEFIKKLGPTLDPEKFEKRGEDIWVAKSAKVAPTACLNGPLIIDEEAEIRHCAFVRGSAIVGKGSVVGNSTELKNDIIFNSVQVPHYNYVWHFLYRKKRKNRRVRYPVTAGTQIAQRQGPVHIYVQPDAAGRRPRTKRPVSGTQKNRR